MPMDSEVQPLGSVLLGSGDFRLVRWPVVAGLFTRPSLMLTREDDSGGGG